MFKNRAIQMKLVKTTEGTPLMDATELPKFELPSKEDVIDVSESVIQNSALAVISVIGAAALARTISEIVIHHATK